MSILETERFILQPINVGLAPVVLDYWQRNRSFMQPWVQERTNDFFELGLQQKRLQVKLAMQLKGQLVYFYIFSKKDVDQTFLLGIVGCSNIVRGALCSCFLGYSVDEAANGKGVATEALKRVIQYTFEELELHRVEANIMPRNTASLRVVEKLGFRNEGLSKQYLKINGKWEDHVRMALLKDDFR